MARFKSKLDGRLIAAGIFLTFFGLLIVGRLFFLQVISREHYQILAERQHISYEEAGVRRGKIFLREKNGEPFILADTKSGYVIYIDPRKIEEAEKIYDALSDILPEVKRDDFLRAASKKDDPFEIVSRRVDTKTAEKILSFNLSGVGALSEEWRNYPARNLASAVVGFVGYKEDEIVGRYGIEYSQENILKGEEHYLPGRRTFTGTFLDWGKKIFPGTKSSASIVLTIEPQVQFFIEDILDEAFEKWKPERAGAVVMDSSTGKILAMASRPAFDPNFYNEEETLEVFINPMVEHVYELGSVFKPLTMAAALDLGVISPETTYFDAGFLVIDGSRIENYDGKGRGTVDMQNVLSESLNTGAVFVMRQMGAEAIKDYFWSFGLGNKTGIELPGEVSGNLTNLDSGREIESATASFGQGVSVTPVEFLRAINVLANGGKLVKPFIIDRIIFDGLPDEETKPRIEREVIKPETAEEITRMLVRTVDEALLGGILKNEHYTIAAKTGTAQMPNKSGGGYSEDFLHAFFGYGPAYDSKFSVMLFLVKPIGARYASHTLSEPFMEIMKFLFSYYNVSPDR